MSKREEDEAKEAKVKAIIVAAVIESFLQPLTLNNKVFMYILAIIMVVVVIVV